MRGRRGPAGPSSISCRASAFSSPVTRTSTSRAASSVRRPTVSASRGTRSAPPKSPAAAAIVDAASATRRTPSPGREPGSLNATCASRPSPSTARSIGAASRTAWYRAASTSGSGAAPSSASRRPSVRPASSRSSSARKLRGSSAPSPRYSSSPSTVTWAVGSDPSRAWARSAAYMPRGVCPVGSSRRTRDTRAQAVGDQLGRGQPDVPGLSEHQDRRDAHASRAFRGRRPAERGTGRPTSPSGRGSPGD